MKTKFSWASGFHMLGGFIIGVAGLMGAPALWLVLTRERYQETETYVEASTKALTNVAWSDLGEWATGAVIGLAIHIGLIAYYAWRYLCVQEII